MNQNLIVRWSLWKLINMSKVNLNRKFAMSPRLRLLALFCLVILFLFIFNMIQVLKQENQELQSEIWFFTRNKISISILLLSLFYQEKTTESVTFYNKKYSIRIFHLPCTMMNQIFSVVLRRRFHRFLLPKLPTLWWLNQI